MTGASSRGARYQGPPCRRCGGIERYVRSRKCAACDVLSAKAWRDANLEKSRAGARARHEAAKERRKVTAKAWRAANAEKVRTDHKAWCEANPGRNSANAKAWREANPEKSKASNRAWADANPEAKRAYCKAYRASNLERCRAREKDWRTANHSRVLANNRNREALQKNACGNHSAEDVEAILKAQRHKCAMCRASVKKSRHVDHIMPLSKGGSNWPSNLQALCPNCNVRKQDKDPIDFAREQGLLL